MDSHLKFLNPKTASLVRNYKLLAQLIVDGYFAGHHRGPRHAFSLEYSKHRDYYPGDPLKLVDWKLFGRTDRLSVKQFEEETNLEAWICMDTSRSMSYSGTKSEVSKLEYASYLAAALAYVLLRQKDLVGMLQFDSRVREVLPPSSASRQLNLILSRLKRLHQGAHSQFEEAARHAASRIKRRGLIMLFSDLLAQPSAIEKTLKYFLHQGSELLVFHVLSYEELHFPFKRFGFFEDMETKQRILMQPALYRDEYLRQIQSYLGTLKKTCSKLKISYQLLDTRAPFDQALKTFFEIRSRMN